jgi:hypothetical protein
VYVSAKEVRRQSSTKCLYWIWWSSRVRRTCRGNELRRLSRDLRSAFDWVRLNKQSSTHQGSWFSSRNKSFVISQAIHDVLKMGSSLSRRTSSEALRKNSMIKQPSSLWISFQQDDQILLRSMHDILAQYFQWLL